MKLALTWIERLRHVAQRAAAWRWSKPLARSSAVVIGIAVLAWIGHATFATTAAAKITADPPGLAAAVAAEPSGDHALGPGVASPVEAPPAATSATPVEPAPSVGLGGAPAMADAPQSQPTHHGPATPEDPVVLNTATAEDLQRLPGIGQKRAQAILAVRTRIGKFRQIEDLLKVRGLGRATLRRLRPLIRIDPPAVSADAGAEGGA